MLPTCCVNKIHILYPKFLIHIHYFHILQIQKIYFFSSYSPYDFLNPTISLSLLNLYNNIHSLIENILRGINIILFILFQYSIPLFLLVIFSNSFIFNPISIPINKANVKNNIIYIIFYSFLFN